MLQYPCAEFSPFRHIFKWKNDTGDVFLHRNGEKAVTRYSSLVHLTSPKWINCDLSCRWWYNILSKHKANCIVIVIASWLDGIVSIRLLRFVSQFTFDVAMFGRSFELFASSQFLQTLKWTVVNEKSVVTFAISVNIIYRNTTNSHFRWLWSIIISMLIEEYFGRFWINI